MPINVLTTDDFTPKTADEAARAFGRKAALTSDEFDTLSVAMKAKAFRIAKVNNARLVQQARDLLERSIRDGGSFADFRRHLLDLFDTAGIPRPALSRLRLAFHQNTMQAYSDARRETLDKPEVVRAFPYRRYMTVGNGMAGVRNVRADHAVLHGKIFAWDDPFWDRFTPPWDYGCRCTYLALPASAVNALVACGKILPDDKEQLDWARELALKDPADLEMATRYWEEQRPQQGKTTPPARGSVSGGASNEETLLKESLEAHKGNHKESLIALQARLMTEQTDTGLTRTAARERCEERYPLIFG